MAKNFASARHDASTFYGINPFLSLFIWRGINILPR
jgi:hypothetical protein